MNLIEAVKTGLPFKRPGFVSYLTFKNDFEELKLRPEDILADDWHVPQEGDPLERDVMGKLIDRVLFLEKSLREMKEEFGLRGPLVGEPFLYVQELLKQRIDEALKGNANR